MASVEHTQFSVVTGDRPNGIPPTNGPRLGSLKHSNSEVVTPSFMFYTKVKKGKSLKLLLCIYIFNSIFYSMGVCHTYREKYSKKLFLMIRRCSISRCQHVWVSTNHWNSLNVVLTHLLVLRYILINYLHYSLIFFSKRMHIALRL